MLIIADNPTHKPFPVGMNLREKTEYLLSGKVTVGRFVRIRNNDFVNFYLPRIRGKNFVVNTRKFKHPGYQTADQAFTAGVYLLRKIKKDL